MTQGQRFHLHLVLPPVKYVTILVLSTVYIQYISLQKYNIAVLLNTLNTITALPLLA